VITVTNKRQCTTGEYIGRPSPLGNPYRLKPYGPYNRGETINLYRAWLTEIWNKGGKNEQLNELFRLAEIERNTNSLTLICWCAPKPCHGNVIADFVRLINGDTRE